MADSETVLTDFESATYTLEQLGKTFNELVSRKDDLVDLVQWKDIEEYFHNLEKLLKKRFDELEEEEKEFVKKESETQAFIAKRDAVVAAKEQALLDRMQQIKDSAVLAIVEAQKSYKITSQNPDDVGNSTKNKGILLGCSALFSSGEGNCEHESKDELPCQRKNYADRVPKIDAAEVPESPTLDSGTLTSSSQIESHCQSDLYGHCNTQGSLANDQMVSCDVNGDFSGSRKVNLSGHCNTQGSLANDQMMSCDVNGDFAGSRKVDAVILNLPQHPTLSVFHTKVKVEYPDNGLISPESGFDSHVGGVPGLNISEVPKSGFTDSGGVAWCSKCCSGCQYNVLSVDFNRRGVQGTDCICSNQMTACKVKGDSFGPKHVSVYKHNLLNCPTLSTFPIKVKVENCENDPLYTFGDGIDAHVDRVPELNAAEVLKRGVSIDSGTVPEHSKNTWGCGYGDVPGDHNGEGTQVNGSIRSNQLIPYDGNGDLVGHGNVDSCFSKTQLPTYSAFPIKVKVEHSNGSLTSQYGGPISGHGDKGFKPDSANVSGGGNGNTVDSCMVTLCSQNASSCQYRDLSGDCSRPGMATNENICSNRMAAYEAKGDFVRLREVDNSHNLSQLPTLTTFPVRVKVEYSDNEQIILQEQGVNGHVDGDAELNASSSSQNASVCQYDGFSVDCNRQKIHPIDCTFSNQMTGHQAQPDAIGLKNVNVCVPTSHVKVKVEGSDNDLMGHWRGMDPRAGEVKSEINGVVRTDDLDHILLKERHKMLLSRQSVTTVAGVDRFGLLEGISLEGPAYLMEDSNQHIAGNLKDDGYSADALSSMAGTRSDDIIETKKSEVLSTLRFDSSSGASAGVSGFTGKMKFEIMENGSESPCLAALGTASNYNMLAMEDYQEISHESYEEEIDHMILRDRIKLLMSSRTIPSFADHYPTVSENSEPRIIKNRRKRKKTVTDSVETALEEDAPGLLQVLVDKGIALDEIKLYGGMEVGNALDDAACVDSFGELEDVISKVFSQSSSSLLKFAPVHCTKGSKTSYCLACLISLVDQTHYLQFRKWPVEWGWCRDLQSFIFVFERHNRIVLERPEYGYATYFFELVDSLPSDWQIKRLVTAMKLASCSRITIIENRSLVVGEDLTEGEARVLEEYGWSPNTGLGSMLNYCDRVVHDRKNEKDGSEWRSKIGKLLMDGYNGGTIVLSKFPKKAIEYKSTDRRQTMEYMDTQSPKIAECKVSQNSQFIEDRGNQSSHFIKCEGTQSSTIKLEFS
ncbi:hypothetical protein NE237_019714 [Protea cynaroides]|uniref:Uncharacterized protein n=1 Tax=Protea cynaroides TaxID=273540 RepID=A0A9Q0H5W6_9MAGN|nr:hypothetical protein NE237_019714 [Protea cynaroides]